MATVASIEMVVFCAVGGRVSLLGAVYGALIVNAAKSSISESFPELWTIAMGLLFIAVVLIFPKGTGRALSAIYSPDRDVAAAQKEYDQTQSKHRSAEMKNPDKKK
ncbi:hypothetical protein LNP25_00200 [Klebsiella variicola subsp. variicola]|nr:hypothetical protein [Klebsiella variicola subsp. variicola]